MANTVNTADLDKLIDGIARLPDELRREMYSRGLDAAGKIITEYQRGSLHGVVSGDHRNTGQLAGSIKAHKRETYVEVYPTGKRRPDGKRRDGQSNATVGFVLERGRGAPGVIAPREWMEKSLQPAADDVADELAEIYDDILNKILGG